MKGTQSKQTKVRGGWEDDETPNTVKTEKKADNNNKWKVGGSESNQIDKEQPSAFKVPSVSTISTTSTVQSSSKQPIQEKKI